MGGEGGSGRGGGGGGGGRQVGVRVVDVNGEVVFVKIQKKKFFLGGGGGGSGGRGWGVVRSGVGVGEVRGSKVWVSW